MNNENEIFGYEWDYIKDMQQGNYKPNAVNFDKIGDYGCDPIGNNMFKMVPSGDIVSFEERTRRLGP